MNEIRLLTSADADAQSLHVYLDTFDEFNVRIYGHFGFAGREQRELPELGLPCRLLQYPAPRREEKAEMQAKSKVRS